MATHDREPAGPASPPGEGLDLDTSDLMERLTTWADWEKAGRHHDLLRLAIEATRRLQQVEGLEGLIQQTVEAIRGLQVMRDTTKPRKLDEALTWRQNDELAEARAVEAISRLEQLAAALTASPPGRKESHAE